MKLLAFALCLTLFFSCESSSNGRSDDARPDRGTTSASVSEPFEDRSAVAEVNRVENARLVLFQAKAPNATMIMVNSRHRGLADRPGRLKIAMGDAGLGFKRISDLRVDHFLQLLDQLEADQIAEPFGPQHERMLKQGTQVPGFQGIIVVENAGRSTAYVGRRPSGANDEVGRKKFETFTNLKWVLADFYNGGGYVEYVDQAAGLGAGSGFDR
ncbi:MAG: hypothetical protein KDB53_11610 [Planctomycetes bacterium]|nr:hypothetical protein [Planctomycetota bacterium]